MKQPGPEENVWLIEKFRGSRSGKSTFDFFSRNILLNCYFQHPLSSLVEVVHRGGGWDERDRRLILWHFEDLLKQRYKEFINIVKVTLARMF